MEKEEESAQSQPSCLCENLLDHVAQMTIKEFNCLPPKLKDLLRERRRKHKHMLKMRRLRNTQKHRVRLLANEGATVFSGTTITPDGEKVVMEVVDQDSAQILHTIGSEKVREFAKLLEKRRKYQGGTKTRHRKKILRHASNSSKFVC